MACRCGSLKGLAEFYESTTIDSHAMPSSARSNPEMILRVLRSNAGSIPLPILC